MQPGVEFPGDMLRKVMSPCSKLLLHARLIAQLKIGVLPLVRLVSTTTHMGRARDRNSAGGLDGSENIFL
jgi:hypothetical protein